MAQEKAKGQMSRKLELHIIYSVNDTTVEDVFLCTGASRTMTPHATVVCLTDGVEVPSGRPVEKVLYRSAWRSIGYYVEEESEPA